MIHHHHFSPYFHLVLSVSHHCHHHGSVSGPECQPMLTISLWFTIVIIIGMQARLGRTTRRSFSGLVSSFLPRLTGLNLRVSLRPCAVWSAGVHGRDCGACRAACLRGCWRCGLVGPAGVAAFWSRFPVGLLVRCWVARVLALSRGSCFCPPLCRLLSVLLLRLVVCMRGCGVVTNAGGHPAPYFCYDVWFPYVWYQYFIVFAWRVRVGGGCVLRFRAASYRR